MTPLRELAERWKHLELTGELCVEELLAILDAEGDGWAVGGEVDRVEAHSVEEVLAMAAEISDYGGTQAGLMLTAYAERIKADENAVTADVVQKAVQAFATSLLQQREEGGSGHHKDMRAALLAVWPNPPAQAAQVDAEERLGEAIRSLIRGDIKCSDDLPEDARPKHASARRAFAAVHALLQERRAHLLSQEAEISDLRADRDSWRDQASNRVADWDAMRLRADLAVSGLAAANALLREWLPPAAHFVPYEVGSLPHRTYAHPQGAGDEA